MKGANCVSTILQMFGLPIPKVPQELVEKTEAFIGGLGGDTGYACVNSVVEASAGGSGQPHTTALSRFQQHEFQRFLKQHDPEVLLTGTGFHLHRSIIAK